MKAHCHTLFLAGALFATVSLQAAELDATYTERITDEKFQALRNSRPVAVASTPSEALPAYNIVASSDFISFDGYSTLVPKGAILSVPAGFQGQILANPVGKILIWSDFLTRNRARVATFPITLREATGAKAIDPKHLETAVRSGMILVAAINGNPTSVAPTRKPPTESPTPHPR